MTTHAPGPRQAVDRACHPTLGDGVAVYNNGPAYFAADSGEVVVMREIGFGGWCKAEGSWLVADPLDGPRVKLATTGRQRGERHERVVADMLGAGWLVGLSGQMRRWRFEPDGGGNAIVLDVVQMFIGKPSDMTKKGDVRARIPKAHENWSTMQTRSGSFFVYQREAEARPAASAEIPPRATAAPSQKPAAAPEQMGLPL